MCLHEFRRITSGRSAAPNRLPVSSEAGTLAAGNVAPAPSRAPSPRGLFTLLGDLGKARFVAAGIVRGEVFAHPQPRCDAVWVTPGSDSDPSKAREIPDDSFDIRGGSACSPDKWNFLCHRQADRLLSPTAIWRGQVVGSDGLNAVEKGWPEVALVLAATRGSDR